MKADVMQSDSRAQLRLSGELNIYAAAALKKTLIDAVHQFPELEVDLSSVAAIDTAGLQVLALARGESCLTQKPLRFFGHSHAVMQLIELLGVKSDFGGLVGSAGSNPGA